MAKRKIPSKIRAEAELRRAMCGLIQRARQEAGWSYVDLAEKMAQKAVRESGEAIRQQLYRGSFSATFLLRAMEALGIHTVPWGDLGMPEQAKRAADSERARDKEKINQETKSRLAKYSPEYIKKLERM